MYMHIHTYIKPYFYTFILGCSFTFAFYMFLIYHWKSLFPALDASLSNLNKYLTNNEQITYFLNLLIWNM